MHVAAISIEKLVFVIATKIAVVAVHANRNHVQQKMTMISNLFYNL